MTIDVNVIDADEDFLDDIDEVIEDTMVQIFVLRAADERQLDDVKQKVTQHNSLFYYAPIALCEEVDSKCVGFLVTNAKELALATDKALYVDESSLDEEMITALVEGSYKGIILNATKEQPKLKDFHLCITPSNIDTFAADAIANLPMEKMVLASSYPNYGFEEIFSLSKKISDKNFRPDQSIIAQATQNALVFFGFKKG